MRGLSVNIFVIQPDVTLLGSQRLTLRNRVPVMTETRKKKHAIMFGRAKG